MMYISKVSFSTFPRFLSRSDVTREHNFVMSLFPTVAGEDPRSKMDVLFRKEAEKHRTSFLVQSNTLPSLDNVKSESTRNTAKLETKEVEDIYRDILSKGSFSYKVRVNTVKSVDNKRQPVRGEGNIQEWWKSKAAHHGFITNVDKTSVLIEQASKLKDFSVSSSTITGIAEVDDANRILDSIRQGLGKSKSYGFGMLLIGRSQ